MKITLDLNDALLAEAEAFSARQRIGLAQLIEEALQMRLRQRLPVHGKGGLKPGLDGRSNKALWAAVEDGSHR